MPLATSVQLPAAYAFTAVAVVAMAMQPKPLDKAVFAAFAPWLSSGEISTRVHMAGAVRVAATPMPFLVRVEPGDAGTSARLRKNGALAVWSATAAPVCGKSGGSPH